MNHFRHCAAGMALAAALLLGAPPAAANDLDEFLGWTADGAAYAVRYTNDGTAQQRVDVCFTDPSVRDKGWPKGFAQPPAGDRCDSGTCDEEGNCQDTDKRYSAVKALVRRPAPAKAGPHGESISVKKSGKDWVVSLTAGGKTTTIRKYEKDDGIAMAATLKLGKTYWRPDGGAFAAEILGHGISVVVGITAGTTAGGGAASSGSGGGAPDSAAATAANDAGMKLYRAKDYAKAAAQFRAAIAADPGYVKAHYNLACVASLAHDRKSAIAELKWLQSSADPAARARIDKARSDADLKWISDDPEARAILAGAGGAPPVDADSGWAADFAGFTPAANGTLSDAARGPLSRLPGSHDENCDTADDKQSRAMETSFGGTTVRASLRDGVSVHDAKGALVAVTLSPPGCSLPGASQDILERLGVGQVVPDSDPEYVILYGNGGKASWAQAVQILKRKGDKLVPVFASVLEDAKDGEVREGKLSLGADGSLVYQAPGKSAPKTFKWSAAAFQYK